MKTYSYVGEVAEIHNVGRLDLFGQTIQLKEETRNELAEGGCLLIPKEAYDKIGFPADRVKALKTLSRIMESGDPALIEKVKAAHLIALAKSEPTPGAPVAPLAHDSTFPIAK